MKDDTAHQSENIQQNGKGMKSCFFPVSHLASKSHELISEDLDVFLAYIQFIVVYTDTKSTGFSRAFTFISLTISVLVYSVSRVLNMNNENKDFYNPLMKVTVFQIF